MPEQVEARVDCESGGVMVSWEPSKGALSYTTVAQGSAGYNSTCSNTETTCLLDDLLRGLNYTITVIASDDVCNSTESSVVEIGTGTFKSHLFKTFNNDWQKHTSLKNSTNKISCSNISICSTMCPTACNSRDGVQQ